MSVLSSVIFLVFSVTTVFAVDQHARLDALRVEANEAVYNLDYEGARSRCRKMIELLPEHPAGPQCYASTLWVEHLNRDWASKATLYNDNASDAKTRVDRKQADEFHRWTRHAKQLAEARLRKDPKDVEALYFLGAAEGVEAAFAAGVERKFMSAFRSGKDSVERHRKVLKLEPEFRDAELTIGILNYVVGSLPLPAKMLVATMGVRGSKKRGLETLERVAVDGKWARDVARVVLLDLYKREKRWEDGIEMARELAEKYPRNYLFKLQMADALTSQIVTMRKQKKPVTAEEKDLNNIFISLLRDKRLDAATRDLVNTRWNTARQQLKS